MSTPPSVPAEVTAAVVSAFLQPTTSRRRIPGTSPRQYEETIHIPSGRDSTMVVEPAADGYPHLRSLTFEEILAVAYPVIAAHVRAHPERADQAISPVIAGHRSGVQVVLADLAERARHEHDPALQVAVDALHAVHDLFDGADTVGARGTWQAEARAQIHNAIVDSFTRHLDGAAPTQPEVSETVEGPDGLDGPHEVDETPTWRVEIFEPGTDPGWRWDAFTVTAATADAAAEEALAQASTRWPDARALTISEICRLRTDHGR